MSYDQIKELAKQKGLRVRDLLALSEGHDPFYVGRPKEIKMAEWAATIYRIFNRKPFHVRGLHYWAVSQPNMLSWNGEPYLNTTRCWGDVTLAVKYARYLGMIPHDAIVDRKNPEPKINAYYWDDKTVDKAADDYLTAELVATELSEKFMLCNPRAVQPYHMEIWIEKSAMDHILIPIARSYGVNLQTAEGEISLTRIWELITRLKKIEKPVRIFIISDFDPVGQNIPVSISRKIEFFARILLPEKDIRVDQIALTKEQCIEYKLPRTPLKETDRQKNKFEAQHGTGATELDALESLYPGVFAKIVKETLDQYYDKDARAKTQTKNQGIQAAIKEAILEHKDEIENILAEVDLEDAQKIEEIEVEKDELPEDDRDWLYQSDREYYDQIQRYKVYRGS